MKTYLLLSVGETYLGPLKPYACVEVLMYCLFSWYLLKKAELSWRGGQSPIIGGHGEIEGGLEMKHVRDIPLSFVPAW
jgi:hypothetical protein